MISQFELIQINESVYIYSKFSTHVQSAIIPVFLFLIFIAEFEQLKYHLEASFSFNQEEEHLGSHFEYNQISSFYEIKLVSSKH